ncbi:MAG: hypothetical protein WBF17_23875 [Phycisphaerae bacterium]
MRDRDCLGLIVAGLLTGILSSGCNIHQAYPGPRRPADQVAMIRGTDFSAEAVRKHVGLVDAGIDRVDGKEIGSGKTRVEVLPGRHTVELSWLRNIPWYVDPFTKVIAINMTMPTPRKVSFDAAAGREYVVSKVVCADVECTRPASNQPEQKGCCVFVEDAGTGSVVAQQFYVHDPNRPFTAWGQDYPWFPR